MDTHSRDNSVFTHKTSGFTLIEVLVVMVIVGISIATIGLSIGGDPGMRKLHQQAEQLNRWFAHIQKSAAINTTTYAIEFDSIDGSLAVMQYREGEWHVIENKFEPFTLADGVKMEFMKYSKSINDDSLITLRFYPNMQYTPFKLALSRSQRQRLDLEGNGVEPINIVLDEKQAS